MRAVRCAVTRDRRRAALASAAAAIALCALASGGDGDRSGPPASGAPASAPEPAAEFTGQREAIFDAFYSTGLDPGAAYTLSDVVISKDNTTFDFRSGVIVFARPVGGETTGAVFLGEGEIRMTPPNGMQRYMLRKYSGAELLKEPFTEAALRFIDHSDRMLRAVGTPVALDPASAARAAEVFKDRNELLDMTRTFSFEMQYLEARISQLPNADFFLADLHTPHHDWLTYIYNPLETHEHFLATSETTGATKGRGYFIPWGVWHKSADYDRAGHYVNLPERDGPRLLQILDSRMDLDLPDTKTVRWNARLRIRPALGGLRCLRLDLDNNADFGGRWYSEMRPVRVTRIVDASDTPLTFMHRKDRLLILLPQPTVAGEPLTISVDGTADVIYQLTAESFGLLESAWYPQYGYLDGRHPFDWTVKVPKPFLITGSGTIVREFEDKATKQNGIEAKSDLPVSFPWVIFGRFQKDEGSYVNSGTGRTVRMTIHSFPTMTITITDHDTLERLGATRPITFDLSAPMTKVKSFFAESEQVLKLFETLYGPYPYDELHIAQMAPQLGFGQAPMGFVQLTGIAFLSQARLQSDFVHGFLAHEIAHQWWGHQISEASSADSWLSESFAEYASGIFVKEYQGAKRFQRTLEIWKRNAKLSDAEAPIAAAFTLAGPNFGRHWTNLLYNKGPYILHMLRVQLGDEKYVEVMRSLHQTFRERNITTEMLLAQINRATGSDFTPFFDQWIWGTGVPAFRYSWRAEGQADGRTLVTVHISQQDRSNPKKVIMPVYVHFKGASQPSYLPVVKAEEDLRILCPASPKDVTLDDDHTLLADIIKSDTK